MDERIARVVAYHERTKHGYPQRFARSLGHLDWAAQPDPFRRYEGAELVVLEEVPPGEGREATWGRVCSGTVDAASVDARAIAQLFYDSLAISAWKQAGSSKWALRCNPSSGNLHPTEGYLLCGAVDGITETAALFHYAPHVHGLERRRVIADDAWRVLSAQLPEGAIVIGLTSIVWREAWKYGERAFRYCMEDVGHAIGAVTIAARTLGWSVRTIEGLGDDAIARLLAVGDQVGPEAERPDVLLAIVPRGDAGGAIAVALDEAELASLIAAPAIGVANALSEDHHDWPVLEEVEEATRMDVRGSAGHALEIGVAVRESSVETRPLVRRRRSAVDMDGRTSLPRARFFEMLRTLVPALTPALWALPFRAQVHPVIFVHRVEGIEPGLALLVRDAEDEPALRGAIALAEDWTALPDAPDDLPLYGIASGDARHIARAACCHQDIAADGAFAIAFLARFEPALEAHGAAFYRRLHWDAGLLGQLLYLEAEAAGVQATGIGCYFDDAIHELLGLGDRTFQVLYCFTVGVAVHDARIQTLPAYGQRSTLLAPR
ncbi:MAG: SagB/ThcOx family dehydrogenase [Myxococcota bacterium]|nr:SagB/ThcOx family dehydrogenase [Myxococcota bacterium]